jgi:copper chaperone NosL
MTARLALVAAMAIVLQGCAGTAAGPAVLDVHHDACEGCRMAVSDARFAAQLVVPGETPKFFDDIGCLATYVARQRVTDAAAVAYVADHRTKQWVPAAAAVYSRVPGLATPMSSGLVAHADGASRSSDPTAGGGTIVAAGEIFGDNLPRGKAVR